MKPLQNRPSLQIALDEFPPFLRIRLVISRLEETMQQVRPSVSGRTRSNDVFFELACGWLSREEGKCVKFKRNSQPSAAVIAR